MKVYTELGSEMFTMKGNDIFHNYFDTVNVNIRTAMEHKSDEREMEQGGRESVSAEKTSPPEAGKTTKGSAEKAASKDMAGTARDTAEKVRKTGKEMKQPLRGRWHTHLT